MPVRFVLFDLVGTLLDERADHEALDKVMADVVRRFRVGVSARVLSGRFALALMEIVRGEPDVQEEADFVPFREAAPEIFAGVLAAEGYDVTTVDKTWFWETYLDIQRRTWRTYREVPRVLDALLDRGLRLGVLTDADRYMLDDILPRLGLADALPIRVAAEDAGHVKPHPAPFRLALEQADTSPADTVMVGDSYERDILGAAAAGIERAVLVDRHNARTVDVPRLQNLRKLPQILDGWVR